MRISSLIGLFLASSLIISTANAQDSAPIKADSAASKAAEKSALTDFATGDANNLTTGDAPEPTKRVPIPTNVFARPEPEVVAKWDGGKLTNLEVSATLSTRRPANVRTLGPEQFAKLPRAQQIDTVKKLAWEKILLQNAREAGINENTPKVADAVEAQELAALNRAYYTEKITPRLEQLTEETALEYYNENKRTMFTKPPITVIRAVHVNTYEMVTAEAGDTLRDLAANISGDAEAAGLIRESTPPYYLRQAPTELEDSVLSSPLKGGEVLYVPMGDVAVTSATALASKLRQQLLSGKTANEIAAETRDADFGVSVTQPLRFTEEAGYWEEIETAVASLEDTSVSELLRTPAGINIIVLEDRQTSEAVPFEQVKDDLIGKMTSDTNERRQVIEQTREETLDRLWKKYDVKVNTEAIQRANYDGADGLSTNTVIAHTGDLKYTLQDFLTDLRMTGKDWGQLTEQERLDVLKVASKITNYLIGQEAREMGLDETPEFKKMMQSVAESEIVAAYLDHIGDTKEHFVTDAELRAYYKDNLDNYTSSAEVTIRELSKRINMTLPPETKAADIEEARKSLEEIRSRIESEEDFTQLARRESEAISTRSRGGLVGTVDEGFRGEAFKNQIRQLKIGEISMPFMYGSEMMIIRLDDRTAPTVQPFESVTRRVMQDYARTMPEKLQDQKLESALEEANFELTF